MREYILVTDSTSDLPADLLAKHDIAVIPMVFQSGKESYLNYPDGREIGFHEFYEKVVAGATFVTAQINYTDFVNAFEPILQSGKDVLYISFSSGLSGTYQNSLIVKKDLLAKYPESKIECVDSLCASVGEGMLVYNAALQKEQGLSVEELAAWVTKERLHLCHWFTVDDLNYLKRGGRVSATAALVGTMLNVKPVLHVDDDGHLIFVSKARGRKHSLEALVEHMEETCVSPEDQVIFIGHGDCLDDAKYVEALVRSKFPVKDVIISYIGPVIGSHCGQGVFSLFYFGTKR